MFSSFFSTSAPVDPTARNFHPATDKFVGAAQFGELAPADTEWLAQSSGFVTETQTFYTFLDDGGFIMCQVIHSSTGVWYPTIQFTFKMYDGATKQTTWKSINVTNFTPAPAGLDKRSCKADEFSFTFRPGAGAGAEDAYAVTAKLGDDVQVSLTVARPAGVPGFKLGGGPTGGYSLFGPDGTMDPAKAEGYVIHRFWPRTRAAGLVVTGGHARTLEASAGMFVHAIQGMRPNLVASRWNFAHFQAPGGASAVQMEFTTTAGHGPHGAGSGGVRVNIGALVLGDKLVAVTGETHDAGAAPDASAEVQSRAEHLGAAIDADTGYAAPTGLLYTWAAPSAIGGSDGPVKAVLQVDVGGPAKAEAKGLVEKVDILAEIPWVIRKAVNYAAGTKPFIYQWCNPATLMVSGPESIVPGGSAQITGNVYNEATFISE